MTRNDAIAATYRQEFTHRTLRNSRGEPVRCRVNGKCKTRARFLAACGVN